MFVKHNTFTVGEIPQFFGQRFDTKNKLAVKSNDGFSITWGELNERSNKIARLITEDFQLKKGDSVITFLHNCGQYPEIIYGIGKAGLIVAPISFRFVARELKYAIDHSDARAIILSESLYEVFKVIKDDIQIPPENVLIIGNGELANYENRISQKSGQNVQITAEEDDYFWMGLTGGTTGYPKAALTTHRSMVEHWRRITIEFTVLEDDYELICGAFYHGLGFLFGLQQLSVGGSLYICNTFNPSLVLEIIEEEKITATPMVPTMYNDILNYPQKKDFDVTSMRVLVCAGSALLTRTKKGTIEYFSNAGLYEYYGSTEHGFFTIIKPKDQLRKNRSCGLPFYGMQIKILDENGNPVQQGQVGEIYKKGLLLGKEYYKNKEATEQNFRGDWASSGDMGYLDEEGFLYIVDRKKDMIISGGVNIFPTEIEEILQSHPSIKEVSVVGLPDEKWGEVVSAFIVKSDQDELTQVDIVSYCDGRLANYKKPKYIEFLDSLPKNAAGKILRRELRDSKSKSGIV
ncbi:class I adenylate-forming enzyme family protein [Neobacillus sp. 114]|uniref:class I adenylate-forming enzyme family protein n=1 Tax=Neobacillus sp. 114 TaxID=3048535 RepID=UPI0024C2D8B9|nr:class I adenylate-forming enzyme family protein [Neobacillus sp. 114]